MRDDPAPVGSPGADARGGGRGLVIITRPVEQSRGLEALLRERGFEVLLAPAIRRVPPESWDELDGGIRGLRAGRYDGLLFTSPAGVASFAARWNAGRDVSAGVSAGTRSGADVSAGVSAGPRSGADVSAGVSAGTRSGADVSAGVSAGALSGRDVSAGVSAGALSGRDVSAGVSAGPRSGADVSAGVSAGPRLGTEVSAGVSAGPRLGTEVSAGVSAGPRSGRAELVAGVPPVGGDVSAETSLASDQAFSDLWIAAVGPGTAAALRSIGLDPQVISGKGTGADLANALVERLGDEASRMRFLLPRALEGREELARGLGAAGAKVDIVAAYRTHRASADEMQPLIDRLGDTVAVAFASPSAVEAVLAVTGGTLGGALAVAIGETTAGALRAAGVKRVAVATHPDDRSMLEALLAALG